MASICPSERVLREHLQAGEYRSGELSGAWRLVGDITWPIAHFGVTATKADGTATEYVLRVDLNGYPNTAPTSMPWDLAREAKLAAEDRPQDGRAGLVFRPDWQNGEALYAPYDRVAIQSHPDWAGQYLEDTWSPTRTIGFLLSRVHEVLNEEAL